jgi:hypothetical protein
MLTTNRASTGNRRRRIVHLPRWVLLPSILPLLGGCLWFPLGSGGGPRMGLQAVERTRAPGAPVASHPPITEPGSRGYLFVDSVIAVRTRVSGRVVRFRLWNHGREPITVLADERGGTEPRPGVCPPDGERVEVLRRERREPDTVMAPGASQEYEAVPAVPAGSGGATARPAGGCPGAGSAGGALSLRLTVEAGGARYLYTFWYRATDAP